MSPYWGDGYVHCLCSGLEGCYPTVTLCPALYTFLLPVVCHPSSVFGPHLCRLLTPAGAVIPN